MVFLYNKELKIELKLGKWELRYLFQVFCNTCARITINHPHGQDLLALGDRSMAQSPGMEAKLKEEPQPWKPPMWAQRHEGQDTLTSENGAHVTLYTWISVLSLSLKFLMEYVRRWKKTNNYPPKTIYTHTEVNSGQWSADKTTLLSKVHPKYIHSCTVWIKDSHNLFQFSWYFLVFLPQITHKKCGLFSFALNLSWSWDSLWLIRSSRRDTV